MAVRAAINGFGRTGRAAFRASFERGADIEWVAINDVAEPAMLAQLLKYDTVYGPFAGTVEVADGALVVERHPVATPSETDPAKLPWEELGVDVVIESTGRFRASADAEKHLAAGAKKVIVSAPAKEPDVTVALGVNFDDVYDPERHHDRLERVVHDELPRAGGEGAPRGRSAFRHGLMTTVHAYTGDQQLAGRAAQGLPARTRRRGATSCRRRRARRRRSAS